MKQKRLLYILSIVGILSFSGVTGQGAQEQDSSAFVESILSGIDLTTSLPAFHLDTEAHIDLNGNLIHDSYGLYSEIDITQGSSPEDLMMSSVSSSDQDDIITKSHYENGFYTVNDGKKITETEGKPEEILETVAVLTDLVKDTAETITEVTVSETDAGTEYEYELMPDLAKEYLDSVLEELDLEELDGADVKVTKAVLVSTINPEGLIVSQELHLDGKIKKAIFSIPVHADMKADFSFGEN